MNTEKVRIVEQRHSSVTNKVENIPAEGGLTVSADVTEQNGQVTGIDTIEVKDAEGVVVWSGYASPNLGGNFYTAGRELEVMTALIEFINAVRNN